MSLRITRIDNLNQLNDSLRDQWNRLPLPSPMQSADWLLRWWRTFGSGDQTELCVLLVFDDSQLVGVAPWYLQHGWARGSTLRFLGDGMICSDHATILTRPEHTASVLALITDWLRQEVATSWHSIQFDAIDQSDPAVNTLLQNLDSCDFTTFTREADGCWTVDLPPSWEEFMATLSKNHRKRCRRWWRTYFESGRAVVIRATAGDADQGWKEMSRLNRQRQAIRGDESAFDERSFHQFHLSVLPSLIANGKAELRKLQLDGKIVAAEYVLFHGDTVFCYQSGMASTNHRDGYGNLSILGLFHDFIAQGCNRLDFLRGDEAYKQHWGACRTDCVNYHVASRSLPGAAHVTYYRTLDGIRSLRNSLIGSPA